MELRGDGRSHAALRSVRLLAEHLRRLLVEAAEVENADAIRVELQAADIGDVLHGLTDRTIARLAAGTAIIGVGRTAEDLAPGRYVCVVVAHPVRRHVEIDRPITAETVCDVKRQIVDIEAVEAKITVSIDAAMDVELASRIRRQREIGARALIVDPSVDMAHLVCGPFQG